MNRTGSAAVAAILALCMQLAPARAQDDAGSAAPAAAPWSASCASDSRDGVLECVMQQRVVLSPTGQFLAAVTVLVRDRAGQPEITVQLPFGIDLSEGVRIMIDDAALERFQFRTCDAAGCYAGGPLSDVLLAQLRQSEAVSVSFQDMNGREIRVPVSLLGFSEAHDRIR